MGFIWLFSLCQLISIISSHVSTFGLLVCFDTSQWIEQSTFGVNIFSKNESVNILFLDCSNPFICIDEDLVPNDLALQP